MNPILSAALGSIIRWALAAGAGYLVKAGIWSGTDAETYVAAGAMAVLGLGWSLYSKYHGRIKLLLALEAAQVSEQDIKDHLAWGGATPAVSTPAGDVPVMLKPQR